MPQVVAPWTWRRALRDHGPQDRGYLLALMMLGTFLDRYGFAFPSLATWAAASRNSIRQQQRYLARARGDGWLVVERAGRRGKGWAFNGYRCSVPDSIKLDDRDQEIGDGLESQAGSIGHDVAVSSPWINGNDATMSLPTEGGTDTVMASPAVTRCTGDALPNPRGTVGDDISGAMATTNPTDGYDKSSTWSRHPDGQLTPALRTLAFRTRALEAPLARSARDQEAPEITESAKQQAIGKLLAAGHTDGDIAKMLGGRGVTIEQVRAQRAAS